MAETRRRVEWDGIAYGRNRNKFGHDDLRRYAGEWLAWNLEGTAIVAHHEDAQEVVRQIRAMGLDTDRVVMECMPLPEEFEDLL